ncbi:DUF1501 domain-containing protein [Rhodopirellula sp. P2]|uniref:DUF1501 domain-containing protein n=1 Tax=Rhodopirellula sp. P2 TaxID=2127060 RepID=UPI0023679D1F|nr:DUF1501 domain-containing protein [Rhodopirellula sp. P2]WDQ17641.1 DUF1501 domain-containing protein [Rhodopirellula sp. P2]
MSNSTRRQFLASSVAAAGAVSLPRIATAHGSAERLQGKAEHVISIWLGGGMGQIDTFDPKAKGDPKAKRPGGYYDLIDTAVEGVQVCEHLSQTAKVMDRVTAVRTVNHDVIDEHAAATNRMHTGRAISGTVTYPSLGSLVAHERGPVNEDAPPYVLIGYPNVTRGPGFLGSKHGYLYLTETGRAPAGLSRPDGISNDRQTRREQFLATLKNSRGDSKISKFLDYESAIEQSMKLSGPDFTRVFQLDGEPDDLRNRYGGEFGQRCLLSRRLVESGVRFIEVSHNLNFLNGAGWDVHNSGIVNQHKLIQELDTAVSTLIMDLEAKKLLDKTLIVITSEFGRPPEFDSGGGRGHQGSAFSCVLAGGGLAHCGAYGETDHLAKKIVSQPVGVPDFFATICAAVGIDYSKNLYAGDRPVPLTDQGQPIRELFAS